MKPGYEYLANIEFKLSDDQTWASKGFLVASNQFALTALATRNAPRAMNATVALEELTNGWKIKGKNFEIRIDKSNGGLSSYKWNGEEQIVNPFLPHFKRPLTDNDRRGWKPNKKLQQWYEPGLTVKNISAKAFSDGIIKITSDYSLIHDSASVKVIYTISRGGIIKVDYSLSVLPGLPNIPKIGMQGAILRGYENITWYGKGPMENYIDRNYGSDAAIYSQNIFDFMEPYVVPQENGNRTDVRWMYLANSKDEGLMIIADSLLSMSAWPYTEENIENAKHTVDLKDAGLITLNIDLVQMGVGGNDSWSDVAAPLEKYQIPAKPYQYSFYFLPVKTNSQKIPELVKKIKF
jgi:beta-galactosidase